MRDSEWPRHPSTPSAAAQTSALSPNPLAAPAVTAHHSSYSTRPLLGVTSSWIAGRATTAAFQAARILAYRAALGFDPVVHRQSQAPRLQGVHEPLGRVEGRQQARCQDVGVDSAVRTGSLANITMLQPESAHRGRADAQQFGRLSARLTTTACRPSPAWTRTSCCGWSATSATSCCTRRGRRGRRRRCWRCGICCGPRVSAACTPTSREARRPARTQSGRCVSCWAHWPRGRSRRATVFWTGSGPIC